MSMADRFQWRRMLGPTSGLVAGLVTLWLLAGDQGDSRIARAMAGHRNPFEEPAPPAARSSKASTRPLAAVPDPLTLLPGGRRDPTHAALVGDFELTTTAITELRLSRKVCAQVDYLLQNFRDHANRTVASRAVLLGEDSESGESSYLIPALPDLGLSLRKELFEKLSQCCPATAAAQIVDGTLRRESDLRVLGGFGAHDVEVVIQRHPSDATTSPSVHISNLNPASGQLRSNSQLTAEQFHRIFGSVMNLPAPPSEAR